MIDIHCHILPGFDDGPQSFEESLEMLRMAARHGTTDVVATPHANTGFEFSPERVRHAVTALASATNGAPRLHRGCDFHLSAANLEAALVSPSEYTINGASYLLVELPEFYTPSVMAGIFDRLQAAGALPIVTHPERNPMARSRLADLEAWVGRGAFVQVTAQSFLGRFGADAKSFSDELSTMRSCSLHRQRRPRSHRPPTRSR
jgi:protein-tyrosine phosphatase